MWEVETIKSDEGNTESTTYKHTDELLVKDKYRNEIYNYLFLIQHVFDNKKIEQDELNNLRLELIDVYLKYYNKHSNNKKDFSIKLIKNNK
jgi:hypothetical protein